MEWIRHYAGHYYLFWAGWMTLWLLTQTISLLEIRKGAKSMTLDTRTMVIRVMPEIVVILKKRFPNLTAEEAVKMAGEIADVILTERKQPVGH